MQELVGRPQYVLQEVRLLFQWRRINRQAKAFGSRLQNQEQNMLYNADTQNEIMNTHEHQLGSAIDGVRAW